MYCTSLDVIHPDLDIVMESKVEQLHPDLNQLQEQPLTAQNGLTSSTNGLQSDATTPIADLSIASFVPPSDIFDQYLRNLGNRDLVHSTYSPGEQDNLGNDLDKSAGESTTSQPKLLGEASDLLPIDALLSAAAIAAPDPPRPSEGNVLEVGGSAEMAVVNIQKAEDEEEQLDRELEQALGLEVDDDDISEHESDETADLSEEENEYRQESVAGSSSHSRSGSSSVIHIDSRSKDEATHSPSPQTAGKTITASNKEAGQANRASLPSQARLLNERTRHRLDDEAKRASGYESGAEEASDEDELEYGEEVDVEEARQGDQSPGDEYDKAELRKYREIQKKMRRTRSVDEEQEAEDVYFQDEKEKQSSGLESAEGSAANEEEYDSTSSHGTAASNRNKRKWDEEMEDELKDDDISRQDRAQQGTLEERVPIPAFFKKRKGSDQYDLASGSEENERKEEEEETEGEGEEAQPEEEEDQAEKATTVPVEATSMGGDDFTEMTTEEALAVLDGSRLQDKPREVFEEASDAVPLSTEEASTTNEAKKDEIMNIDASKQAAVDFGQSSEHTNQDNRLADVNMSSNYNATSQLERSALFAVRNDEEAQTIVTAAIAVAQHESAAFGYTPFAEQAEDILRTGQEYSPETERLEALSNVNTKDHPAHMIMAAEVETRPNGFSEGMLSEQNGFDLSQANAAESIAYSPPGIPDVPAALTILLQTAETTEPAELSPSHTSATVRSSNAPLAAAIDSFSQNMLNNGIPRQMKTIPYELDGLRYDGNGLQVPDPTSEKAEAVPQSSPAGLLFRSSDTTPVVHFADDDTTTRMAENMEGIDISPPLVPLTDGHATDQQLVVYNVGVLFLMLIVFGIQDDAVVATESLEAQSPRAALLPVADEGSPSSLPPAADNVWPALPIAEEAPVHQDYTQVILQDLEQEAEKLFPEASTAIEDDHENEKDKEARQSPAVDMNTSAGDSADTIEADTYEPEEGEIEPPYQSENFNEEAPQDSPEVVAASHSRSKIPEPDLGNFERLSGSLSPPTVAMPKVPLEPEQAEASPIRRFNAIEPGLWTPSTPIRFGGQSLEAARREAAHDPDRAETLKRSLEASKEEKTRVSAGSPYLSLEGDALIASEETIDESESGPPDFISLDIPSEQEEDLNNDSGEEEPAEEVPTGLSLSLSYDGNSDSSYDTQDDYASQIRSHDTRCD